MRKRLKVKARCCGMCKPHKRGWSNRWKVKVLGELVRAEREIREESGGSLAATKLTRNGGTGDPSSLTS